MIFPWHCYALAQGIPPHPAYRLHKRCEGIAGTKTQETQHDISRLSGLGLEWGGAINTALLDL
jgi:hypothetical protein